MKHKFYSNICKAAIVIICMLCLISCADVPTNSKHEVSIAKLTKCTTRGCLLSKGIKPVSSKKNKNGIIIEEIYKVKKPANSDSLVTMDEVLDVATSGVWGMAGGSSEGDKIYKMRVLYTNNGEDIKSINLFPSEN